MNNDRSQKPGEYNSHTYVAYAMAFAQSIFLASFWKLFSHKNESTVPYMCASIE